MWDNVERVKGKSGTVSLLGKERVFRRNSLQSGVSKDDHRPRAWMSPGYSADTVRESPAVVDFSLHH